jgi:hypothetical protein
MRQKLVWLCALACCLLRAPSASAQDSGSVGLTMGYPSAVGLMWHVTEGFAIRPEVSFSTSENPISTSLTLSGDSGSSSSSSGSRSTSTGVGLGISGLFYIGKWDALRAYVAPRFVYSRNSGTFEYTSERFVNPSPGAPFGPLIPVMVTTTTKRTFTGKSGSGLFGASYSLHQRFSVFGEVGFGYETSDMSSTSTPERDIDFSIGFKSHGWSTRTGVGVIFYF